jgi:hypothetical protein
MGMTNPCDARKFIWNAKMYAEAHRDFDKQTEVPE